MATVPARDKYRSFLHDEPDTVQWRHGGPPTYDAVNQLFEEGRIKEWPEGSLEETVQNAIKSWEMELSHKVRLQDFKSINPEKFKLIVNDFDLLEFVFKRIMSCYKHGDSRKRRIRRRRDSKDWELQCTVLPKEFQYYKADEESFESSHEVFRSAFPRGFAWEIISVYSGPPVIAFKFRHWGIFEGPYKGHVPTGEKVEFYGLGTLKVCF
ncbi:hypothetical protein REPUB_Repub05bG0077100 [Reevesia pubescens]